MVRVDSGIRLALHVAGVLQPGAARETSGAPSCSALEALLDRAVAAPCSRDLTEHLCARFGLQGGDVDLPLGALTRAARGETTCNGAFALLSAVHLFVDRDRVYVIPLSSSSVSDAESDDLQQLLREQLATWCDDVQRETTTLWTLALRSQPALQTIDIESAAGRDARDCLPRGADAGKWMTLVNELQMLLHAHPMNVRREQIGQPAINSVWLWGVGSMPQVRQKPFAMVYSDRVFVRGLAALSGVPNAASPERFTLPEDSSARERPACIALFDAFNEPADQDWTVVVERLERDWFSPLRAALRVGSLRQATLWLGNGREYAIDARQAGRWRWRRPRALLNHAAAS